MSWRKNVWRLSVFEGATPVDCVKALICGRLSRNHARGRTDKSCVKSCATRRREQGEIRYGSLWFALRRVGEKSEHRAFGVACSIATLGRLRRVVNLMDGYCVSEPCHTPPHSEESAFPIRMTATTRANRLNSATATGPRRRHSERCDDHAWLVSSWPRPPGPWN